MLWALALLGLVPAAFTLVGDDGDEGEGDAAVDQSDEAMSMDMATNGDLLEFAYSELPEIEENSWSGVENGNGANFGDGILEANDPATPDTAGPIGSPSDVVLGVNDPDKPDVAGPVGSPDDSVLSPNVDKDDVVGDNSGGIDVYDLGDDGDVLVLPDDPQSGGVAANIVEEEGGLTFDTDGTLNIVNGGNGDDTIALGDDASVVHANDGNDTIYGGDGAAIMDGGDGHDLLFAGRDDGSTYVMTGGAGSDGFGLYFDGSNGAPAVTITDYAHAEDVIMIEVDKVTAARGDMEVTVGETEDGLSSEVFVNGVNVAVVNGATGLTAGDIVVRVA
ncbi:calcium-binding protein [Celeribacter sp.]|uniref:calcium-binding protein n=1 Tax=Celeribacter sp. TaxID=1890673 RepID=UPI003A90EB7D